MVVLEDGRIMPVPVARVRPLLSVLHELIDTGLAPKVRLPRLDAVRLADLEHEADLKWSGGRRRCAPSARRLADFAGIEPVPAPRGLRAELRPYQVQGVAWLQFLRAYDLGGILADDMGLGKTVETLAHILIEREAGRLDRPALVVAPTSVVPNWRAETARFAPDLRVHVSHGLRRKESFGALGRSDVVLTTYPLLARDKDALLAQEFHLVILDEAQQVKNAKTQAAKVVQQLQGTPPPVPHRNAAGEPPGRAVVAVPVPDAGVPGRRRYLPPPVPHADREARRRAAARSASRAASGRSCCAGPRSRWPPSCRPRPRSSRRSSWEKPRAISTRPCAPRWTSGCAPRSPRAGWPRARSWCSTRCSSCARPAATRACSSWMRRRR